MRILAACLRVIAALFQLFPLRRQVVLLSRQSGTVSADFRLLAEQLREDEPTLEVVVNATDSELGGWLQFAWHSLAQLWLACTSRVVVLDGYNPAVCIPKKRRGIYVIQLWHAAGAIKKFGYQCLDTPAGRSTAYAKVARMHKNYDCIVAAGRGAVGAYSETFGYPQEAITALGLPHFDQLAARMSDTGAREQLVARHPWLANDKLNVVYAPTLRRTDDTSWLTKAVDNLAKALAGTGVNLIVSKHPLTIIDEDALAHHAHVHILKGRSTAGLLPVADVLISDYSAIALEAGLVGIPALFYVPDIEEYRRSTGLNIDPVEHPLLLGTPNARELARALTSPVLLSQADARYQSFISEYFAGIDPTSSTARIAALIKSHV